MRKVEDFSLSEKEWEAMSIVKADGFSYARLDFTEEHWHGFTFNPHLASLTLWQKLGGFSRFPTEWHISRALRSEGCVVAYHYPGKCVHIGGDRSMTGLDDLHWTKRVFGRFRP